MKKANVAEFDSYCKAKNFTGFCFDSEEQPPEELLHIGYKLMFTRLYCAAASNRIILSNPDSGMHVSFRFVRRIEYANQQKGNEMPEHFNIICEDVCSHDVLRVCRILALK